MNIIFGKERAEQLGDRFTVLELDTFVFVNQGIRLTAYCVVESVPLDRLPLVESWQNLHAALIKNYQQKNWKYCCTLINQLQGAWNSEMDSFYNELAERIDQLITTDPGNSWTWEIQR